MPGPGYHNDVIVKTNFSATPESLIPIAGNGERGCLQQPQTGSVADECGERVRSRVLSVKLDFTGMDKEYKRVREIGWQCARYANQYVAAKWAEAKGFTEEKRDVPHAVTKNIRNTEKMELSGAVYAAMERDVTGVWNRLSKRILAGSPLPQWDPNSALPIRGAKKKADSGVQISEPEPDHFVAELAIQSHKCEGGCWVKIPINIGTCKDWQADLIRKMVSWEVPITRATVVVFPMKHRVILRLSYPITIALPRFGNRCASLGPIVEGRRLTLRTETETLDYTGRLHAILARKDHWDGIRRRARFQFGKCRGQARVKRKKLSEWSWDNWLDTQLNQWTREIINYLDTQGIAKLTILGLSIEDWPVFRFVQMLKNKGEEIGITVDAEADLAEPGTERAVKREIGRKRRQTTKKAGAIRTLLAS